MPAKPPSWRVLAIAVVVVIVAAGVGAGFLYLVNHPKRPASPTLVRVGDNVTVNYIGIFGSGPETGKVFDTSIQAVAEDNATYPKSLEYTPRNTSGYTPLPVHVGPSTPKGGYSLDGMTFGSVVTGFWKGLIGLAVNQTHSITVSPAEGYGSLNTSCLRTAPMSQTLPVDVGYTASAFSKAYSGVSATEGTTFKDPTYGWTDLVLSSNSTNVVVAREPSVGETVKPYGWSILVADVTSSTITLTSQLTPASVGQVLGNMANVTVCSATKFLVWSVDLSAGTFVENYNTEVTGETLIFTVTVTAINP